MFGDMPRGLFYWRCDRPLAQLGDAIRRVVRRNRIEYLVVDSIAYACGHAPEAADTAANYKRAVDRLRSLRDYFAVLDSRGGSRGAGQSLEAVGVEDDVAEGPVSDDNLIALSVDGAARFTRGVQPHRRNFEGRAVALLGRERHAD